MLNVAGDGSLAAAIVDVWNSFYRLGPIVESGIPRRAERLGGETIR